MGRYAPNHRERCPMNHSRFLIVAAACIALNTSALAQGGGGGGGGGAGGAGGAASGASAGAGAASGSGSSSTGSTSTNTTGSTSSQTSATPNKSTNYFNPGPPAANSAVPNDNQSSIAYPAGSTTGVAPAQTNPDTLNATSSQTSVAPSSRVGIAPTQTHPNSHAPPGSPAAEQARRNEGAGGSPLSGPGSPVQPPGAGR